MSWRKPKTVIQLIGALGAVFMLIGPIGDWVRASAENKNKELEIEQTRLIHRQDYVYNILNDDSRAVDKLSLLKFMMAEYPNANEAVQDWYVELAKRLESEMEVVTRKVREERDAATDMRVKQQKQEELDKKETQLHDVQLITREKDSKVCAKESVSFEVYKPFANNRLPQDYPETERIGILQQCQTAAVPGVSIWKTKYAGPDEKLVPKWVTCFCLGVF